MVGNTIGDCSQVVAGNAAIQINPTANGIRGLVISSNIAWDDQASPTSQMMISLTNSGQNGVIDSLAMTGNLSINPRNAAGVSNSMPVANLSNSYVGLASAY